MAVLALAAVISTGCAVRSPVLMFTRQSTTNPKQLPLRVGIVLEASPDQDPTTIITVQYNPFPIMTLTAAFPKPVEMEYVQDAVVDYFRDSGLFRYTYPYPFDSRDVDVVVRVRPTRILCDNDTGYSGGITLAESLLSYIGLIMILACPQEHFSADFAMEFIVQKPDGTEIAKYTAAQADKAWVYIYAQPFANYMWYESVFRKCFLGVMDEVRGHIERDADKITAAAGVRRS